MNTVCPRGGDRTRRNAPPRIVVRCVVPYQSSGRDGADVALEVDDECNDVSVSDLRATPPPAAAAADADASTAMQR